jgi:hypothetical protein
MEKLFGFSIGKGGCGANEQPLDYPPAPMVYAVGMNQEIIERNLREATTRYYWLGVAMGSVGGFIAGALFWH